MRVFACLAISGAALLHAAAATTIDGTNRYAYGANFGWVNCQGDVANGAVIGEYVCSGSIYSANVGWVLLGSGSPANGIRYQNNSPTDYGVNHDGGGNLGGYAWGANIGWLTFTNRDATGTTYDGPRVDLVTGRFSGFAWSANCGWISLSNAAAFVQTDRIVAGSDTDGDGIADAWELSFFGNLTTANGTTDFDVDGSPDLQEYLAGTNPIDSGSNLRITSMAAAPSGSMVTLTWSSTPARLYRLHETNNVVAPRPWPLLDPLPLAPDAGATTTRSFADSPASFRFFEIEAVRPLTP